MPKEDTTEELATQEFEVVCINRRGEVISRVLQQNKYYCESLGDGIDLEMIYIPGGTFIMGSPDREKDSNADEGPEHEVIVKAFYLSKYTITQAQWQAVVNLPKIRLDLNQNPSYFKGDNRPVERVDWYSAVECCARLKKATGKGYRLPTVAEWEYACRAGTVTPFHYGETLTSDLANYDTSYYVYAEEPLGEYRRETTSVGSFPPNGFGLYDMHGNVYEWCADDWYCNYHGAPKDGSAWRNGHSEERSSLRGGAWNKRSQYCRSAHRSDSNWRHNIDDNIGFRVCCEVGKIYLKTLG